MEKGCKICCQPDYFDTPVWVKMIHPKKVYILFENSRLKTAVITL
jgi:hypothetical protein